METDKGMEKPLKLVRWRPVATAETMEKIRPEVRAALHAVCGEDNAPLFVGRAMLKEGRWRDFELVAFEVVHLDEEAQL